MAIPVGAHTVPCSRGIVNGQTRFWWQIQQSEMSRLPLSAVTGEICMRMLPSQASARVKGRKGGRERFMFQLWSLYLASWEEAVYLYVNSFFWSVGFGGLQCLHRTEPSSSGAFFSCEMWTQGSSPWSLPAALVVRRTWNSSFQGDSRAVFVLSDSNQKGGRQKC